MRTSCGRGDHGRRHRQDVGSFRRDRVPLPFRGRCCVRAPVWPPMPLPDKKIS